MILQNHNTLRRFGGRLPIQGVNHINNWDCGGTQMMKKPYGIWKIILWCIISVYTGAMCLLLSSCGRKENDSIYGQDLYAGEIQEADVFIDIPNLRQYGSYTCGATCVQMLMNWLEPYQKDMNLVTYEELLETSEEAGTPPENIIKYFEENGVKIIAQEKRTIDDLVTSLKQGHPMLMCIQAWSAEEDGYNTQNPDNAETYLAEGHWVICVGYQNQKMEGYFISMTRRVSDIV